MALSSTGRQGRREGEKEGRRGRQARDCSAFYFMAKYLTILSNGSISSFLFIFCLF